MPNNPTFPLPPGAPGTASNYTYQPDGSYSFHDPNDPTHGASIGPMMGFDAGSNTSRRVTPSTPLKGYGTSIGSAPTVDASRGDIGQQISAYFKSRGVSDQETPYWVQKWAEFGSKDPGYFNQRLAAADIFGGGSPANSTGGQTLGSIGGSPSAYGSPTMNLAAPITTPTLSNMAFLAPWMGPTSANG